MPGNQVFGRATATWDGRSPETTNAEILSRKSRRGRI